MKICMSVIATSGLMAKQVGGWRVCICDTLFFILFLFFFSSFHVLKIHTTCIYHTENHSFEISFLHFLPITSILDLPSNLSLHCVTSFRNPFPKPPATEPKTRIETSESERRQEVSIRYFQQKSKENWYNSIMENVEGGKLL